MFCVGVKLGLKLWEEEMEDVWEQGAWENIWTLEGWSDRRREKIA
jgi:hypothetical protein